MSYLAISLFGLVIGIWIFLSPGTLCAVIFTLVLLYAFALNLKGLPKRKVIIGICILAIVLRFLSSMFNYCFSRGKGLGNDFIPDARAYSASGQYIAETVAGKPMLSTDNNEPQWLETLRHKYKGSMPSGGYRVDFFARYIGWLYSAFGYEPIAVKFINSFLSIFTGILLFFLVKDMFSVETAKISLVLSLFWPSIFLWSITGLKDSLTIFLVTVCIFNLFQLKKYVSMLEFLLIVVFLATANYMANLLLLVTIIAVVIIDRKFIFKRQQGISTNILMLLVVILVTKVSFETLRLFKLYLFIPLLSAFLLSIISFLNKKKLIVLTFILFCLVSFLPFYLTKHNININKYFINFTTSTIAVQKGQLVAADTGYRIYPERFYKTNYADYSKIASLSHSEFIVSYLKGLIYTLFSPFPWSIHNKITFFVYFQMIIYYILVPFIFLGLLVGLRYKWRHILPIIIFIFIVVSTYALFEGNMGTIFRHRDVLTTFFLVFASIGIGKFFGYSDTGITKT